MKKLKSDAETIDRLSELPESLILHILSFLRMIDVVRTTLLSKSWQYLWTTIPCQKFDSINSCPVQTRSFVNRALILWKGTKIRKFEIDFSDGFDSSSFSDMDLWLLYAKERNVEDLSICLPIRPNPEYWLPQCLYECSSITKLKLYCCRLQIRRKVQLDKLTSLKIGGTHLTVDAINKVVSGSPQLRIFSLDYFGSIRNVVIQSSSLKWLSISSICSAPSTYTVVIWAPNLEVLKFSRTPYSKYLLTNVYSLTKANLSFIDKWGAEVGESMSQILPAIKHVETLELSACCFQELGVIKGKCSFSPLLNVKQLVIIGRPIEPNKIVVLLECFPRLKTLVIDWNLDAKKQDIRDPSKLVLSKANILLLLRTVKITWYSYEASIFQFVEHLLKHATMIEKMVILKRGSIEVEPKAAQKLESLQRSFPTVEVMILCKK